ncbi:JNK-interacting protein 3 [Aphelenchoides besseyi]|nr:JNK-interacting protein 3 [Aphelenchoides besseyi]
MAATLMQTSTTSSNSEVVYGTQSIDSSDESTRVMSEKVQMLASSIYKELELMIQKHGEDSVKELMPLVVNVLESLDSAYSDKDEHVVDIEMLKEENEQLLNQYERERQMRKSQDQECKRPLTKIRRTRSGAKKSEFEKLHERYNELLRTHIDHVERTKYLMGPDKFEMMQSLPAGHNRGMAASVDMNVRGISDIISAAHMSQSTHVNVNLANHISAERDYHDEFGQNTEDLLNSGREEGNPIIEELEQHVSENADGHSTTVKSTGQETEDDALAAQLTVNDAFIGMGREVDNLIKENSELLETKNALNIVKNDLIAQVDQLSSENEVLQEELRNVEMMKIKQAEKLRELEIELKSLKEKLNADEQEDQVDENTFPFYLATLRTFQWLNANASHALKWLEKPSNSLKCNVPKKLTTTQAPNRSRIWEFFSGLFGDVPPTHHHASTKPSPKTARAARQQALRNIDMETTSVAEKRRAERRQQYKAVSQHMKKEDENRTRAYGWSIPSTVDTQAPLTIPVPVCCRPLLDQQPSLKIWCAAGAMLHGGLNKDGNFIIGDSIFYSDPLKGISEKIDSSLNSKLLEERFIWETSSLVFVGSSNEKRSYVTILDANNPNCILECFGVCSSHMLCISSVPGVRQGDYMVEEKSDDELSRDGGYLDTLPADIGIHEAFGQVYWVQLRNSDVDDVPTYCSVDEKASPKRARDFSVSETPVDSSTDTVEAAVVRKGIAKRVGFEITGLNDSSGVSKCTVLEKAAADRSDLIPPPHQTLDSTTGLSSQKDESKRDYVAYANLPPHIRDALSKYENQEEMTTALPTVWMGLENDFIVVHSAVLNWRECLLRIKMSDAVLHILHYKGRVFAALANGCIAVFHRLQNGKWSTNGYHVIRLGQASSSVCNLTIVNDKIWVAYRNCIDSFVAHPRKDSQVRHMVWCESGVWVSIRLDSTLRLYHARTMEHLQDVDIEPYLSTMLGNTKMDFLHLRITSLMVLNRKLWIGTGTGVVIAVPLCNERSEKVEATDAESRKTDSIKAPGSLIRVYAGDQSDSSAQIKFIPFCNISLAQFSFHGHKDCVRFFICVPSDGVSSLTTSLETRKLLVISGGDGYIDFRLGEDDENEQTKAEVRVRDLSHLIEWEIDTPNPYKTRE